MATITKTSVISSDSAAAPAAAAAAAPAVFVGIDVSGDRLDLARLNDPTPPRSFANDEAGIAQVVQLMREWRPARIAIESTGKLERPLLIALIEAGLNACHVNPQRVRDFARGLGWFAKTDAIDAAILAKFAEKAGLRLATKTPERVAELAELLACRRQLIDTRTAHGNQLRRTDSRFAQQRHTSLLNHLKKQVEKLDGQIVKLIDGDPDMRHLNEILQSVTGVGVVLAATLIAQVQELGRIDHGALSSLIGVAPHNDDSGRRRGTRHIRGGRRSVRNVLYVCTVVAVRHNPVLRAKYQQLRAAGKVAKVALIACSRKLLRILNAIVRDDVCWTKPQPAISPAKA